MLALDRQFLFVHVPKTGGNSLQNVLMAYSDDEIVCPEPYQDGVERFELRNRSYALSKHSPLSHYRTELPPEIYAGLFKFCCVRNPWERAVSFYFSPHRQVEGFSREDFAAFLPSAPPMAHYLRDAPGQPISGIPSNFDYVMRFESLQADFDAVCDKLQIPRQTLPRRNRSARGAVQDYYDDETVDLVRRLFAEDIELFGYDVPWVSGSGA